MVNLTFDLIESVAFLYFGWYSCIWNKLAKKFGLCLSIILFFTFTSVKSTLLSLPFSAFSHFYIEKKYGFNNMTIGLFFSDTVKSLTLEVIL